LRDDGYAVFMAKTQQLGDRAGIGRRDHERRVAAVHGAMIDRHCGNARGVGDDSCLT
jgi:hypothetical protein